MKLFTIGFTKTTAGRFFTRLSKANVRKLVDVRLNNISQLAGFAKRDDLKYFTKSICHIDYLHLLDDEKNWREYRRKYPATTYAVAKRTLSHRELRQHGLTNDEAGKN